VSAAFQEKYREALDQKHADPVDWALWHEVTTHDPNMAMDLFWERYDRYRLLLPRRSEPAELSQGAIFIHDPFDGKTISFAPPQRYNYPIPRELTQEQIWRATTAAKTDRVIDALLDRYVDALRAVRSNQLRQAFEILTPVFEVGFSDFTKAARAGAALLAMTYPHALFSYLSSYLYSASWIHGNRGWLAGPQESQLRRLIDPEKWNTIPPAYEWNPLLAARRRTLISFTGDSEEKLNKARKVATWDIARITRARHDFAHNAQPLTDNYLLTVTLDLVLTSLAVRCSAVEAKIEFNSLVARCNDMLEGKLSIPVESLLRLDKWELAQAFKTR